MTAFERTDSPFTAGAPAQGASGEPGAAFSRLPGQHHVTDTAIARGLFMWGDVYDRELDDVLRAQDDIALAVVMAVQTKLCTGTFFSVSDVNAWEARTLAHEYSSRHRKADNRRARELYHLAFQREPENVRPFIFIATTHLMDYWFNWSTDPVRSMDLAEQLLRRGLPADTGIGLGHGGLAYLHALRGNMRRP